MSFVGMAQLDDVTATATPQDSRLFTAVSKGYTIFRNHDLLVAKITPCFENGKIGRAVLDEEIGVGSTEFHVVRPGPEIDERYLLHFLRRPEVRRSGELRMIGSGGQRRVPTDFLQQLEVPLPPLEKQRKIAAILNQADSLRAKRRQVLAQLDSLPQAFYRETFDGHSWPVATVADVAERVTDGEHKTPRRSESGVPLLSARNVRDGWIDFENVDYVDEAEFQSLSKRIHPRSGDVLISCSGSIGRVAQVGSRARFAMVRSAALVRPSSVIDSTFLQHHLSTPTVKAIMIARANSSAQANLFQNQIKQLPVNLPPMDLQVQFRSRVEQLATSRATAQRLVRADDELFASLQSRAFRGEL
ncbi:restriction endonuclease subunit S [Rathayibacter sp. AY1C2]|nr:restriction endonuclease subunit S [Rathayibacter sp. AY1C2]